MDIVDLMAVPVEKHDLDWLKRALQAAVELELATIPPYLCAMWSVKSPKHEVVSMIRTIVMEEMAHMGTACNLLTSVGGTPDVLGAAPRYPGPLPGGVHPGLIVSLGGLTKHRIKHIFMEIEKPETGSIVFHEGRTFPTIGAFYDAISHAFQHLPASAVTSQHQLTEGFDGAVPISISSPHDAAIAIDRIKQQGEGRPGDPVGDPGAPGDDFAHYFKFAELFHGRHLTENSQGRFDFTGALISPPEVWDVNEVPAAGYPESAAFDQLYLTSVLQPLHEAWREGSSALLNKAIGSMPDLSSAGRELVSTPAPTGSGFLAPDFRVPTQ